MWQEKKGALLCLLLLGGKPGGPAVLKVSSVRRWSVWEGRKDKTQSQQELTQQRSPPHPPFIIADLTAEMLKHTFRMTTRAGDGLHNAAGSQQTFQPL